MSARRRLKFAWVATVAAMTACSGPDAPGTIALTLPEHDSSGLRLLPWADEPVIQIAVEADDLREALLVTGLPGEQIEVEVPAGRARRVSGALYADRTMATPTHTGMAPPVDVLAGERVSVLLELRPPPRTDPVDWQALRIGDLLTCGLLSNGEGACWGGNFSGHLFGPSAALSQAGAEILDLGPTPLRDLAAGVADVCAIGATGGVNCTGENLGMQDGSARIITGLPDMRRLALGLIESCGIAEEGTAWCWNPLSFGRGEFEQGQAPDIPAWQVTDVADAVYIETSASLSAFGGEHWCVLTGAGQVACWGNRAGGRFGDGSAVCWEDCVTSTAQETALLPAALPARGLAVGAAHACALGAVGNVWCWGEAYDGQLGIGAFEGQATMPVEVPGLSEVERIRAGGMRNCARLTDGSWWCWGGYWGGAPGTAAWNWELWESPTLLFSAEEAVADVALGLQHYCALKADSTVLCWQESGFGQAGVSRGAFTAAPESVDENVWLDLAAGDNHVCGIRADGSLWCWGYNDFMQLGRNWDFWESPVPLQIGTDSDWVRVESGKDHNCGLRSSDLSSLWCWGNNSHGQLGTAASSNISEPVNLPLPPGEGETVAQFRAFRGGTCVKSNLDNWYCNGDTAYDRILLSGQSTHELRQLPLTNYTEVSVGYYSACGVVGTTLHCWGANWVGQLGTGNDTDSPVPVTVPGEWLHVDVGTGSNWVEQACGVTLAGQIACWGDNWGQFGEDIPENIYLSPVLIQPESRNQGFVRVSVSDYRICGLRSNGTADCFGYDRDSYSSMFLEQGYLGRGPIAAVFPQGLGPVAYNRPLEKILPHEFGGCLLSTAGELACWGGAPFLGIAPAWAEGVSVPTP